MFRSFSALPLTVRVVLLASLALNIAFVSALATRWAASRVPLRAEAADRSIARLIARLPRADARVVRDVQRGKSGQLIAARAAYEQALGEAARVVGHDPLDTEALNKAMAQVRQQRQAITDIRVDIYAQAIPRLSHQGRRMLVAPE